MKSSALAAAASAVIDGLAGSAKASRGAADAFAAEAHERPSSYRFDAREALLQSASSSLYNIGQQTPARETQAQFQSFDAALPTLSNPEHDFVQQNIQSKNFNNHNINDGVEIMAFLSSTGYSDAVWHSSSTQLSANPQSTLLGVQATDNQLNPTRELRTFINDLVAHADGEEVAEYLLKSHSTYVDDVWGEDNLSLWQTKLHNVEMQLQNSQADSQFPITRTRNAVRRLQQLLLHVQNHRPTQNDDSTTIL